MGSAITSCLWSGGVCMILARRRVDEVTPAALSGAGRLVCDPDGGLYAWGTQEEITPGSFETQDGDTKGTVSIRSIVATGQFLCIGFCAAGVEIDDKRLEDIFLGSFGDYSDQVWTSEQPAVHVFVDKLQTVPTTRRMYFLGRKRVNPIRDSGVNWDWIHALTLDVREGRLLFVGKLHEGPHAIVEYSSNLERIETFPFGRTPINGISAWEGWTAILTQNARGHDLRVQRAPSGPFETVAENTALRSLVIDRAGRVIGATEHHVLGLIPGSGEFVPLAEIRGRVFSGVAYTSDGQPVIVRSARDGRSWDLLPYEFPG